MKGVIVQAGEPKSIVLFNDGRIRAIPTPAGCHAGMVVTVKLSSKPKIMVIALAAVLLVGLGIFIGVSAAKSRTDNSAPATAGEEDGTPGWQRGQRKQQEIEKKFSE